MTALLLIAAAHAGEAEDRYAGVLAGQLDGEQVECREFAAYGAGASCLQGCIGCVGMAGAASLIDPNAWDPLKGDAPDVNQLDSFPAPPSNVEHPDAWRQGYEEGWDATVQRNRAELVLAGGVAPVVVRAGFIGLYVVVVLAATGAF